VILDSYFLLLNMYLTLSQEELIIMKNENEVDEVVVVDEVVKEQKLPKLNYEYCRANGITKSDIKRFWEKIDFPDDLVEGCCEWNAGKDKDGYGHFKFHGSGYKAHRFSHMIFKGEIGEDLCVRHTCNNPGCVNPHHLLAGTHQDNMNDMTRQNRQSKASGENVASSKLTEIEVKEILNKLIEGVFGTELAKMYAISSSAISQIAHRNTWKDIYNLLTEEQKQKIKNNISPIKQIKDKTEYIWTIKLNESIVDEILLQLIQKVSVKSLAIQYNVSQTNIRNICKGNTWKECYNKLSVTQKRQLQPTRYFSPEETKEIRELYEIMTQVNLATKFKTSSYIINKIIKRISPYNY